MKGSDSIYEKFKDKIDLLKNEIINIERELKQFPSGELLCCKNQNRTKWYLSDAGKQRYISKKDKGFAERMALKKYLTARKTDCEKELRALKSFLKHYPIENEKVISIYQKNSDYQKLLYPYLKPLSEELAEWAAADYEKSSKYQESLNLMSNTGNVVRSKSELLIDMSLSIKKIPYRYECALHLDGVTFHPDFTIKSPKNGQIYYWEHFGMMDDPSYVNKTFEKLRRYAIHGIIPSVQLITTYETMENKLCSDEVNRIIDYYFI